MTYFEAIILGIIQGITEPLPISSSGHLAIFQEIFGIDNIDLTYEVFLNFGSLVAIVILYRKLLFRIFTNSFKYVKTKQQRYYNDFKYFYLVFFASIPAALIGFFLGDLIEEYFTSAYTAGIMLIVTSVFLFLIRKFDGKRTIEDMNVKDALYIGIAQAIALIPGISRSGATIVGAMHRKLQRKLAFDFSFLMFIPISLGVLASKVSDVSVSGNGVKFLIGTVISSVITYFTVRWFRNIVVNGKLIYFSGYCLVVGIISLIFFS